MTNRGMSSSTKKHDVFLSFRGEDTRNNFTSHLYKALNKKPINTYIDYQLNRGENVWPALAKAIEDSLMSVVVFSENYASSKWCLEELVKILECRKDHGQVVIPVFYQTDPSHIRKQTGSYEKAFAKHERDLGDRESDSNKQKVLRWRAALTEAANISGWDSRTHEDDSLLIDNVVNDVLQKLHLRYPIELKGIHGTEKNCIKVESLVNKFRVIGIWGMGGMGKTTIAKVLFAKLFPKYDSICFVDAKEYSLGKLLFDLLKEKTSTSNVVGTTFDMRRLSGKNVFIVLDNVDSLNQIEFLCREYRELSPNSRLIITTRHRQLLIGRVDVIYKVNKWKNKESLKLFNLEAFNQSHPPNGYERLSERAVDYAGGFPLALTVLGSYLRSKNIDFWESTFRKLNNYPNQDIQNVLKVSYDGLDDLEKKIFLDIAFFFRGKWKDQVTRILDACGFEASSGIEVLEDKALITISNSNRIHMHDLLQKMAFEIVRQECSENPGRRSRLRDSEACEVIEQNKGTDAIQGIILDLSQIKDLRLPADTFTKMKALRFLKFYNPLVQSYSNRYLDLPTGLEPFSDQLRYVEWIGYPFESLPSPFCAELLVEIRMPHSNVRQLWREIQELHNLEILDLSECKQLVILPDLSGASRLKWVNLSGCMRLSYLHHSVLSADTLVTLILDRCTMLRSVKGKKHLKSLETISVNGCLSLEEFAVSSDLIENLDLSNTGIQSLDTSIGLLHNLKWLNLEGLRLSHLLKELSLLKSLKELKLSDSGLVIDKQQLHYLFDGLRSLQILHLKECSNVFELPDNISVLSQLRELKLDGSNVKRLPASIKDLQELEILSLENCKELLCLPELPPFTRLLYAVNCTSLVSVSSLNTLATKMIGMAKHISFKNSLQLDGHSLKRIMESLHLTMMSAALHNVSVRTYNVFSHSYNYTAVQVCLPGSRVPRQVKYRTKESSITIELPDRSNLLGFFYYVVLSPGIMKKHGTKINCRCCLEEGIKISCLKTDMTELNSDHVFVWYDPFHCDSILKVYEPKVCFDFCVTNESGEVDDSISVKECGVRLISFSEMHNVLLELDLDSDKKKELEKKFELKTGRSITFTSIEGSHQKESNGSSELSSSDGLLESDSGSDKVEADSAEEGNGRKDHHSNVEESVKSTPKETKQPTKGEDIWWTWPVKSEGNTGSPTEPNARLHEPTEIQSHKENESEEISITEPKSATVELESVEEDNESWSFSDVEESIESTHKETKTSARRCLKENTRESTKVVKSKVNKEASTEPDAGLYEHVESQSDEEYESKEKSNNKKELEKESGGIITLTSTERSHEKESNGSSELSSSDGIVESDCESDKVEADSAEEGNERKDHHSNVEESVKSTPKETKESTNAVKSEVNIGSPTKPNARLHEPTEIQSHKENESEEISITEPKSAMVELESVEEDNESWSFSDVEESIESNHKETKTSARRCLKENTRESTKVIIAKVKSKGNKATPAEPGARLHELIEPKPDKENASKSKSILEPKSIVDEPESAEEDNGRKDHFSYVGQSTIHIHKDTKTRAIRSLKENARESTKVVKSKVNQGASTEPDAGLYEHVESQLDEEHESKEKSITKPDLVMVQLESAEEDNESKKHFSDVEEGIRSTRKETKTSAGRRRKENTTKSTKVVKSKGNASKHKSSENKSDWTDNIEEAKHSEENQNLQGEQIDDLIVEEPYHAKENEPMEGQDGSDEDPVAKLDNILSTKVTSSTSDVAIREALHNIESLLENSLESILGDVELQGQLHMSLKCIQLASEEKVSPNVAKLVESMTSSIEDLFKDFTKTQKVVEDHTTLLQQKEKLLQLVRDAKKRQELLNKETSQCEFETKSLDKEAEKLNENIRILLEKKKTVELKKTKLKETLERCDFEKKKLKDEAKNRVPESRELIVAIEKSESSYAAALSKLKKLNDKWEGFRTTFAENCETLLAHNTWWHRAELLIIFIFIFNIFLSYVGSEVDLHSE